MKFALAIHYPNHKTLAEQLEGNNGKIEIDFITDIEKIKFPCYLVADHKHFKGNLTKVTVTELEHWKQLNDCVKEDITYNRPEDMQYKHVRIYKESEFKNCSVKTVQTNVLYITGCNYDNDGNFKSWKTHYGNIYPNEVVKILE